MRGLQRKILALLLTIIIATGSMPCQRVVAESNDLTYQLSSADLEDDMTENTEEVILEETEQETEEESTESSESTEWEIDLDDDLDSGNEDYNFQEDDTGDILDESTEDVFLEELELEPDLMEPEVQIQSENEHEITMPDLTSHYFTLQKGSRSVREAKADRLIKLQTEKQVSQYMQEKYKDGESYSFVPRFTSSTKVTVGGGSGGGVSLETIEAGDRITYGELYVLSSRIQSKAFNLEKCSSSPYAIYTNVGTWYDKSKNEMFKVDLKLSVEDYTYPGVRTGVGYKYQAPYVGFTSDIIGVVTMGTDTVKTKMEFLYHDSQTPIKNLKGMIQFIDIDAQQGVDFISGFQDIIVFQTEQTKMRYNPQGSESNSIGYVCSGTAEAFNYRDENTTALGIFSGSAVECIWTVTRCDPQDTGGLAKYADSKGYQIPAECSAEQAVCYARSRSSGFLGSHTDIAIINLPPQLKKAVYSGKIDKESCDVADISTTLKDRGDRFTFVLSAASSLPSDIERAYYTTFAFEDVIAPYMKVTDVKVYTGLNKGGVNSNMTYEDVTDHFQCNRSVQSDCSTKVTMKATESALQSSAFYGKNYYAMIEVQIRTEEELTKDGLSLTGCYQKGTFVLNNSGTMKVKSSMGTETELSSNPVTAKIPMTLCVQKTDQLTGQAVEGVTFGLFAGKASDDSESSEPICTARTNKEGAAVFKAETFFQEKTGDGPYYLRELSVPERLESVWIKDEMKKWRVTIESLNNVELVADKSRENKSAFLMENHNIVVPEQTIKVIKTNTETKSVLSGAVFELQQWSEKEQNYQQLMTLKEKKEEGEIYYYNDKPFTNTMDNLGSYQIVEVRQPKGCVLTNEIWEFHIDSETKSDGSNIIYKKKESDEEQKGILKYDNPLEKGKLHIVKTDEEGEPLKGVTFSVIAGEDIYAPWDMTENSDIRPEAVALVKKGEKVGNVKTDDKGIAEIEGLYVGSYLITESAGAEGYVMDQKSHTVKFTYSSADKKGELEHTLNVTNSKMNPSFSIAKLADHTRTSDGKIPKIDNVSGRYQEERIAGVYKEKETVDFAITITNTGNVALRDVHIYDDMDTENKEGKKLSDYLKKDKIRFILPEKDIVTTKNKKKVKANTAKDNSLELILDELDPKDQIEVHLQAEVKEGTGNGRLLENIVRAEASYYNKEGDQSKLVKVDTENLKDEEGNSLTEDKDAVNIPGVPKLCVAKRADRTSGISLKDGRYEGVKTEGIYQQGDQIDYIITVTNKGTADLYNIMVMDKFSKDLKNVVDSQSIQFETGTLKTKSGAAITVSQSDAGEEADYAVYLDNLKAGDSVELHLTGVVHNSSYEVYSGIENRVIVKGHYNGFDGSREEVPETEEMEDSDDISIGQPELRLCKLADKTTGFQWKNGEGTGEKQAALYKSGEKITYSIMISNVGTGPAYQLIVSDVPSGELLKYAVIKGYGVEKGQIIKTEKDQEAKVLAYTTHKIAIDKLEAGDSLKLTFIAELKENIKLEDKSAVNTAMMTAKYGDGNPIPENEHMKDEDTILLKAEAEKEPAEEEQGEKGTKKQASSLKTGDDNLPIVYLLLCIGGVCMAVHLYYRRKTK